MLGRLLGTPERGVGRLLGMLVGTTWTRTLGLEGAVCHRCAIMPCNSMPYVVKHKICALCPVSPSFMTTLLRSSTLLLVPRQHTSRQVWSARPVCMAVHLLQIIVKFHAHQEAINLVSLVTLASQPERHSLFRYPHEFGHKGFEVENHFLDAYQHGSMHASMT